MNSLYTTPLLVGLLATFLTAQAPAPLAPAHSPARYKASQLIGLAITNSQNESLGEIEEIVLDGSNRHIAYAVVGFGGFLGMGEKYFAMPWRVIEIRQRGANETPTALLGVDRETLKAAPGFDKGSWPDMANAKWAAKVDDYYRAHGEAPRAEGAAEPKGSAPDGTRGVDRLPGSPAFTHRRLGQLIGMNVVDTRHKKLADVEDFIVDGTVAAVDGVLLSFGGTLGMGEQLALVPADALTLDHRLEVFVFPCTQAELAGMALKDGKLPALNGQGWLTSGREHCAKIAKAHAPSNGNGTVVEASVAKYASYVDSYDRTKLETIQGTITTLGSVRIGDGNELRTRFRVRCKDGREVVVFAAPSSFVDQQSLALRHGTVVEVTGSPTTHGTQTVLVAGTIKVDGKTATLRDDQGRAAWLKE